VLAFSAIQCTLLYHFLKKKHTEIEPAQLLDWPTVSIHLPVYNESLVAERMLANILKINYPEEKLEIIILDDSDDLTSGIIEDYIQHINFKGRIIHHERDSRDGFKAGALQAGLGITKAEFIAVFDPDFLPGPDFLRKAISSFTSADIGMVQARWTHINRNHSFISSFQAFTLDAHFTIEQEGRFRAGLFINFNGTAGVWRKTCVEDTGAWQADTLNEDIDISFRAKLQGWKFVYLTDLNAPAEIPPLLRALRTQQKRWCKGSAEVAVKLFKVMRKNPLPAL